MSQREEVAIGVRRASVRCSPPLRMLALALALVPACRQAHAPVAESHAAQTIASAVLRVAADRPELLDGEGATSLSLSTTHFMFVRLLVPADLPGTVTWVTFRLLTPSGAVHLERHVPFAVDPKLAQTPSRHGEGHLVNVSLAVPRPGGYALDIPVLVGGSNLQRRPQPGAWTLTAALDDRPELATQLTVELRAGP